MASQDTEDTEDTNRTDRSIGPIIRELPDALVNKIAAGEVVERPASVVKELVENALDAGATHIGIEIRMAGTALIRITDDGCGMSPENAALAIRRHATSKIAKFEDLESIGPLGFRGEALPSIASVAEMEILTRPRGAEAGTSVRIKGGKAPTIRDAGAPVGTAIGVKNLFFNVPARRKFLKTHTTEMNHILDVTARLALANPEVSFHLDRDGRRAMTVPGGLAPRERIAAVVGATEADALFEFAAERGPLAVSGLLSRPEVTRTTNAALHLFVNGRPVRDRTLQWAVIRGYEGLLEKGRYPIGTVYLRIPYNRVDVNVHPAKTEVRFDRPREVESLVREAIREALVRQPWLREATGEAIKTDPSEAYRDRIRAALASYSGGARHSDTRQDGTRFAATRKPTEGVQAGFDLPETPVVPVDFDPATGPAHLAPDAPLAAPFGLSTDPLPEPEPTHRSGRRAFFSTLHYVGQVRGTYLLLEGPDGLFVLDQHAAHERVMFERLRAQFAEGTVTSQRLLLPTTVELERRAAEALLAAAADLDKLGIEVADFGGGTVAVTAVPELLGDTDAERLVRDLADELAHYGSADVLREHADEVFACMACHNSVRAADKLAPAQVAALLNALDEIDLSANCPHGRPVVFALGWNEVEKRFHRT